MGDHHLCDGQVGDEVSITPAMVDAGVYAAREHCLGDGLEALVSMVYLAMRVEELQAECSRSVNIHLVWKPTSDGFSPLDGQDVAI